MRPGETTEHVEVVVVGAGMLGCAIAAYLAQEGVAVIVVDDQGVAGGASGRNSGAIEHPFDVHQRGIYERSVALLRELGVNVPVRPAGVLLLARDEQSATEITDEMRVAHSELEPAVMEPDAVTRLDPMISHGWWGCRLETGFPVPPRLATELYARLARQHGAEIRVGSRANLLWDGETCMGVRAGNVEVLAGHVVVAAGARTSEVLDPSGSWTPVTPSWGVNIELALPKTPRHVLVEAAVAKAQTGDASTVRQAFSLITAGGRTALGSTFLASEPDPAQWEQSIVDHGAEFVPALKEALITGRRVCARPRSQDGRPLIGRVNGEQNLLVATGNGGRGISTGAACGKLVAEAIISESDDAIPAALRASRFPFPVARHKSEHNLVRGVR